MTSSPDLFYTLITPIIKSKGVFAFVHGGAEIFNARVDRFQGFLTGGAGFGLANYTVRFDNVIITGEDIPNKGKLPVVSRGKLATTWGNLKQF